MPIYAQKNSLQRKLRGTGRSAVHSHLEELSREAVVQPSELWLRTLWTVSQVPFHL